MMIDDIIPSHYANSSTEILIWPSESSTCTLIPMFAGMAVSVRGLLSRVLTSSAMFTIIAGSVYVKFCPPHGTADGELRGKLIGA
jgi:hypothetical protein